MREKRGQVNPILLLLPSPFLALFLPIDWQKQRIPSQCDTAKIKDRRKRSEHAERNRVLYKSLTHKARGMEKMQRKKNKTHTTSCRILHSHRLVFFNLCTQSKSSTYIRAFQKYSIFIDRAKTMKIPSIIFSSYSNQRCCYWWYRLIGIDAWNNLPIPIIIIVRLIYFIIHWVDWNWAPLEPLFFPFIYWHARQAYVNFLHTMTKICFRVF